MKRTLAIVLTAILGAFSVTADRYVGGDISLLPEYEEHGAKYKTHDGKDIADLLPWLHEEGMNAMRVRLFVDPSKYHGADADPNACQTLEYITPLCKRIVDAGFKLMLDFHYSDTWADPAKQYTPADWAGLSDEQLYDKIYDYTRETLESLKAAGVVPSFIQPGNEISYGMLWGPEGTPASDQKKTLSGSDANWDRLGHLLRNAIRACNEVCPDAKIVIHTERVEQVMVLRNFYDKMKELNVEYDIIGLSYYPYFHGGMRVLTNALSSLQNRYPEKNIMIVETGYSYKWEVPGTNHDLTNEYPYSDAGQNKFAKDLVDTLEKYQSVNGLFWWWMEYNAYNTSLSGWYNAPLFDCTTGRATSALKTICSFGENASVDGIMADTPEHNEVWFDMSGTQLSRPVAPGLYIRKSGNRTDKVLINR